jgi:Isochorismatase family
MWQHYYIRWGGRRPANASTWICLNPWRLFALPQRSSTRRAIPASPSQSCSRICEKAEADALIISGSETDVCVLAIVLSAVDLSYRVIVARDAACSSSDEGHDMLLRLYHSHFSEQIETADTNQSLPDRSARRMAERMPAPPVQHRRSIVPDALFATRRGV